MILGRLREHQDKSSLAGALVNGGFVVVKAGKLVLALASFAAYAFLFTWQFAAIIVGMLVIHEAGHLRCMKHYGMKQGVSTSSRCSVPPPWPRTTSPAGGPRPPLPWPGHSPGPCWRLGPGCCTSPPATGPSLLPLGGWR